MIVDTRSYRCSSRIVDYRREKNPFPAKKPLYSYSPQGSNNHDSMFGIDQTTGSSGRSEIPRRFDTCLLLVSGVVGVEPKDVYLPDGHYVVNFSVTLLLTFAFHGLDANINAFVSLVVNRSASWVISALSMNVSDINPPKPCGYRVKYGMILQKLTCQ